MLLRLTYLGTTNAFALLRLLPISDHDKDAEILVLRHQITVLQRQLAPDKVRFAAADRALLAALLHRLPRPTLRGRDPAREPTSPSAGHHRPPAHAWVVQAVRNLVMDLGNAEQGAAVRFLIRDRDAKYPALIEEILSDSGIATVLTGVRIPRMNAIMERWVKTLRAELLDRTLVWNESHLRHALHE